MTVYAPPVQRLITELSKLPGVGGRTAQRLAFHLLRASDEEALALARAKISDGLDGVWTRLAPPARPQVLPVLSRRAGGARHAQPLAKFHH